MSARDVQELECALSYSMGVEFLAPYAANAACIPLSCFPSFCFEHQRLCHGLRIHAGSKSTALPARIVVETTQGAGVSGNH